MKKNYMIEAIGILNLMDLNDSAEAFRMLYNIAIQNPHAIVRSNNQREPVVRYKLKEQPASMGTLDPKDPMNHDLVAIKCCQDNWPDRRINAIKELRIATGISLKEAGKLVNKYFTSYYMG